MSKTWIGAVLAALGAMACEPADMGMENPLDDLLGKQTPKVTEVDCATAAIEQDVRIVDFAFDPKLLQVRDGSVVQWTNDGRLPHTVTSGDPRGSNAGEIFDSGDLRPGDSWCAKLEGPGQLDYHCALHPTLMQATVEVIQDLTGGTPGGGTGTPGQM